MINKIKKYPSIIARPYLNASKKDAQWKDNQRYTFENLITVLASYAVSDLLNIYVDLRDPDDDNEVSTNDAEIIESIKNIEALEKIGLEQMALGKWCAVLRETTKVLKDYKNDSFIPELSKLFQPADEKKNKLWADINNLVKQRNNDAHGAVISSSELEKTLLSRQEILDRILEKCSFLEDYNVSVFDTLILESDSQLVSGWKFINTGTESISIDSEVEPPMHEILLIDPKKIEGNKECSYIKLRPLIIYAAPDGQKSKQLSLYSKQLDKEGSTIHYLGVDGPVDIILSEFDKNNNQNLVQRWKYLNEIYSEEGTSKPNLNGGVTAPNIIDIKEENELKITLHNKDSTDLIDVGCTVVFPEYFEIINPEDEGVNNINFTPASEYYKYRASINSEDKNKRKEWQERVKESSPYAYTLWVDEINDGQIVEYEIKFNAKEQGSVRIPSPVTEYRYQRKDSDTELTEDQMNIDGSSIEVRDPNSPDKMKPVINVNRHYLDEKDNLINNVEIGEGFIYELLVTNIGTGAARDLALEVIFPENLELVEGSDELMINLNPSESRSFKYFVTTKIPGQYKIHLRDLSYKDIDGAKYISSFNDDYSIIVKSNIKKQFQFELSDAIRDFTIDNDEQQQLELRKKQLKEIYKDEDVGKWFENALFDASIKNIRKLISSTAKKRGFEVAEKIIKDSKKQAKLNGDKQRKSLIFSIKSIPFFGIDITDTNNIIFHSLDSKIIEKIHKFNYKVLFASSAIVGYTLPLSVKYEPMLWSEDLDINWFKKWINLCITILTKECLPILEVKENVESSLGINLPYLNGMYHKYLNADCGCTFKGLLDKGKLYPEPKKPFSNEAIAFRETGIVAVELINYKGEILLGVEGLKTTLPDDDWTKNNIVFLQNKRLGQDNSNIYKRWVDNERVTWYRINSKKSTNYIYIKVKNNNIDNFLKLIELHRIETSKILLKSDLLNRQCGVDIVKDNLNKLLDSGFLLRAGTVNLRGGLSSKGMLEVYPYKKGFGRATVHNCVGFLHTSNTAWKLYINFYNFDGYSDYSNIIEKNISISTFFKRNGIQQANRTFFIDNIEDCTDKLNMFFDLLFKSIEFYNNNSKSVWPKNKCNEMISQFINTDKDIQKREIKVNLLESLLNGDILENEINKEYKSIVKSCDNFYHKYNTTFPICISNGTVSITQKYKNCLENISNSSNGLSGLIDSDSGNAEED